MKDNAGDTYKLVKVSHKTNPTTIHLPYPFIETSSINSLEVHTSRIYFLVIDKKRNEDDTSMTRRYYITAILKDNNFLC